MADIAEVERRALAALGRRQAFLQLAPGRQLGRAQRRHDRLGQLVAAHRAQHPRVQPDVPDEGVGLYGGLDPAPGRSALPVTAPSPSMAVAIFDMASSARRPIRSSSSGVTAARSRSDMPLNIR